VFLTEENESPRKFLEIAPLQRSFFLNLLQLEWAKMDLGCRSYHIKKMPFVLWKKRKNPLKMAKKLLKRENASEKGKGQT